MSDSIKQWWSKIVDISKRWWGYVIRFIWKPILFVWRPIGSILKHWRGIASTVFILLVTGVVILSIIYYNEIWNIPLNYYDNYTVGIDPTKLEETKLKFISEFREKIIIGYLVFLGGVLTVWRTSELYKQNRNSEKNIKTVKENNDNNLLMAQFAKASELLMDENIAGRLSGIYLFEKIMNSSKEYHWTIIELLTAFVREKRNMDNYIVNHEQGSIPDGDVVIASPHKNNNTQKELLTIKENDKDITFEVVPVEKDIQAIITVLGRRTVDFETEEDYKKDYLDLSRTNLYCADFSRHGEKGSGNYMYFDFSYSVLVRANCDYAHFDHAECIHTHFENAECSGTHFERAKCNHAHFENADCIIAHFENADCYSAHFENADCNSAHFENADCYTDIN